MGANHSDRTMRRECRAFLPGNDVTTMVAGKVDALIGLDEFLVSTFVVIAVRPLIVVFSAPHP